MRSHFDPVDDSEADTDILSEDGFSEEISERRATGAHTGDETIGGPIRRMPSRDADSSAAAASRQHLDSVGAAVPTTGKSMLRYQVSTNR